MSKYLMSHVHMERKCLDASVRETLVWVTGEPHPSLAVAACVAPCRCLLSWLNLRKYFNFVPFSESSTFLLYLSVRQMPTTNSEYTNPEFLWVFFKNLIKE